MKYYPFLLLVLAVCFCRCKEYKMLTNSDLEMNEPSGSENTTLKTWGGKFVKEPFYNKINKPIPGVYDLFFVHGKDRWFVKTINSDPISRKEIEKWLGKKVKITGSLHDGLWDTDDPNVQSRMGTYLAVSSIVATQ